MPSKSIPPFPAGQYILQPVVDYAADNSVDTTETLSVISSAPSVATVSVDPNDNRLVRVLGVAAGSAMITVSAPGVPGPQSLFLSVTIQAPADVSRIEAPAPYTGPHIAT